ncbi:hypothetical protein LSCM4_03159 [Leishmania orientalis]|uniref:BAR domain-containing protein n=1 Tax=Leishmania orientalis TaxID=2249476 RepID=A0A836H732_9TRYP|nr:hypothetical protein LSCM4_03159 [Leishmania orientalis]
MSMQHDFMHPRQLDDMRAISGAIKSFSADMIKMMLLMKELGTTLERVSHSFDALTSLSFTTDEVKGYVHHFAEEVVRMKEGVAFRNYNKLVHEEVLVPVEQLKESLKKTEKAAKKEKSAFEKYRKAKLRVDKQEKRFAETKRALDTSKSYPAHVQARNQSLAFLQKSKVEFESDFVTLVSEVEKVTSMALKRYLELNAGYMTSVVDALTNTDPTVEEAVALYRQEQQQHRQSAIKQRCSQADAELDALYAAQGYRLDPNEMNGSLRDSVTSKASPRRLPLSMQSSPAILPLKATVAPPLPDPSLAQRLEASKPKPSPASAEEAQLAQQDKSTTLRNSVGTAPAAAAAKSQSPAKNALLVSQSVEDSIDDEDFGSVSQVGTTGRATPQLYNFSRGPLSQVSSVPPPLGYNASYDAALASEFKNRMEAKSITASEVCFPHRTQQP